MSDQCFRIFLKSTWSEAFNLLFNACDKVAEQLSLAGPYRQVFWPADGSDPMPFEASRDGKEFVGNVQIWLSNDFDLFIGWIVTERCIEIEIDQRGKSDHEKVIIFSSMYREILKNGLNLIGSGNVMEIIFYKE